MDDLCSLCEATGWPFHRRASGRLSVNLEVPDRVLHAVIEEHGAYGIRMSVVLASGEAVPEVCRQALGVYLLTVSGIVRMARSVGQVEEEQTSIGFEVVFASQPSSSEFVHALSALSVATRISGSEAVAILDKGIAEAYLVHRKWIPDAHQETF